MAGYLFPFKKLKLKDIIVKEALKDDVAEQVIVNVPKLDSAILIVRFEDDTIEISGWNFPMEMSFENA